MRQELLGMLAEVCGEEVLHAMDIDLIQEGLLDSLGLVEFLEAVEDRYKIEVYPTKFSRMELNTPKKLVEIIERAYQEKINLERLE